MDKYKKQKLEEAGWKCGTVEEFLELTPEESALIESKLQLDRALTERRKAKDWSDNSSGHDYRW